MSGFSYLGILIIMIIVVLFILNILTSLWAYQDAKKLGKSNEYAVILLIGTLIFPVAGLLVYLIVRKM